MIIYNKSDQLEIIGHSDFDRGIRQQNYVTKLQYLDGIKRPLKLLCDNSTLVFHLEFDDIKTYKH